MLLNTFLNSRPTLNHLDPNLKNPRIDFFSSISSGTSFFSYFSLHFFSLLSLRWSKMALSVMLNTFQMLLRLVSYLSSIPLSRFSILMTFSSIVYTLSSTKAEMLLSKEASFNCSWTLFRYSLINLWTSEKDMSYVTSFILLHGSFLMRLPWIYFKILLLSSIRSSVRFQVDRGSVRLISIWSMRQDGLMFSAFIWVPILVSVFCLWNHDFRVI